VIQEAAPSEDDSANDCAALFLLAHGCIAGPASLSTLGVRAVREQTAVGSSLFAQPLMLAPVPLEESATEEPSTLSPEDRARAVLATLESRTEAMPEIAELCDYLSLFRRWYYRPEKQRVGEVLLPNEEGAWSVRRLLNAAARVVLGPPAAAPPVDREAAKDLKTKILHEGREGVEREVPVLPKRKRSRKTVTPAELSNENQ
jgi:excinuclease ABC subunit C